MNRTIPEQESLTVEFKSDRTRLPDKDLIETVVCLANTDGGSIYLGVEDDGQITGLHPQHQNLSTLAAMIGNRTNPPVSVRVTALLEAGQTIACIEVPKSPRIVATSDGLLQRRRLQVDGTPQCVPFYPYEFATRQSDLGVLDYSSLPVTGSSVADFDPLERERLRQLIERYGGDRTLLSLTDEELDGAKRVRAFYRWNSLSHRRRTADFRTRKRPPRTLTHPRSRLSSQGRHPSASQ